MLALDTETTGLDTYHGARPYFVTCCDEQGEITHWEWDVDPLTRKVLMPCADAEEIAAVVDSADEIVGQNLKFDAAMLREAGIVKDWPWHKTHDTLIAAHLLATGHPHDLTSLAVAYLGESIQSYEYLLEDACVEARKLVKKQYPLWRIAKEGEPDMPSIKSGPKRGEEKPWKNDAWLPRALAKELKHKTRHPWWTVLSDYANKDSETTIRLWHVLRAELDRRKLWKLYEVRMRVVEATVAIEARGTTLTGKRTRELVTEYGETSAALSKTCVSIAASLGHKLKMPKSGNNGSLLKLVFGYEQANGDGKVHRVPLLDLPVLRRSEKTGSPSLNREAIDEYLLTLPKRGKAFTFIQALNNKRKCDTAISYMNGYKRFWLPVYNCAWCGGNHNGRPEGCKEDGAVGDWFVLHSSLNPTGTRTLRFSSHNPNSENVSRKEGFNLRRCFGPAPGREWWSFDAKNIERRIPAYAAGETDLIALFERPDDPPYYGSEHALMGHVLFPELFEKCLDEQGQMDGRLFKKTHLAVYDRVKRGNFALQNNAQQRKADATYGIPGAFDRLKNRFSKQSALNYRCIDQADRLGYVETMPDRTVDPDRGYPIQCERNKWGRVSATQPFSYYVQGTACWWMCKAMVRCHAYLQELNAGVPAYDRYYMVMQIHDELVFDFPRGTGKEPWRTHLKVARTVQRLMAEGGNDLGLPLPVSSEYHADSYADGVPV